MSKLIQLLQTEFAQEAETTRKMLSRVPNDKYDWRPHPKSMSLKQLSSHLADLPAWVSMALTTEGLDFSNNPYQVEDINDTTHLLDYFERSVLNGGSQLSAADESTFDEIWTLRNGETVYTRVTRYEMIRLALCQIVHHRAQLGVFLRLLDVPIPGSYGPSADENPF